MIQSYPWYIADWRESETRIRLSLAERALYRELLDYCYLEGSIPNDVVQISRIAGCTVHEARKLMPSIAPLFMPEGQRFVHAKVNEVRAKLERYHQQKSHAGAASGRTRRRLALEREMNVRSTAVEPSPTPAPTPAPELPLNPHAADAACSNEEPPNADDAELPFDLESVVRPDAPAKGNGKSGKKKTGKRTTEDIRKALGPERLQWWENFWREFPCKESINPAMDAFERRVHDRELALQIYHGAKRYRAKIESERIAGRDPQVKYGQGWLNDERWLDEDLVVASEYSPRLLI